MLRFGVRTRFACAVLVFLGCLMFAATATSYAAPTPNDSGVISGTVTEVGSGNPADTDVSLWFNDPDFGWYVVDTEPTFDGVYYLNAFDHGEYKVEFAPIPAFSISHYTDGWWNGKASIDAADPVYTDQINSGWDGIDGVLTPYPGSIAGHVTAASGGAAISDDTVTLYSQIEGEWTVVASTTTTSSGGYLFESLPDGAYRVGFSASGAYGEQYYDRVMNVDDATSVSVYLGGHVTGIDGKLAASSSSISGTLTEATTHGGLSAAIDLWVQSATTQTWSFYTETFSSPSGLYSFPNLQGGAYRVCFMPDSYTGLATLWWHNQPDLGHATSINLTGVDTTSSIDAALTHNAGSISGSVTNVFGGGAVGGAHVGVFRLVDTDWLSIDSTTTAADGSYSVHELADGTYKLEFSKDDFATKYWNQKDTLEGADSFQIASGAPITGKNAQLAANVSSIDGTATFGGKGVSVSVDLYTQNPSTTAWSLADSTQSDASDGSYAFDYLTGGNYRVAFARGSHVGFAPQWYNGKSLESAADTITLTGIDAKHGVSAAMVAYSGGVSGTVRDARDQTSPVSGVTATLYSLEQSDGYGYWGDVETTTTHANGTYTLAGVADGVYRVGFDRDGWTSDYYNGADSVDDAIDVNVSGGVVATGRDGLIEPAQSSIEGTATSGGHPAEVDVSLYIQAGGQWTQLLDSGTDPDDGSYSFSELTAGTYRVVFAPDSLHGFATRWWNGKDTSATADSITLTGLDKKTAISAAMTSYTGSISGTIRNRAVPANAVKDAQATLYYLDSDGDWTSLDSTTTNGSGQYSFTQYAPRHYRVGFSNGQGQDQQYWNGHRALQFADDVVVASTAVPNIDGLVSLPAPTVNGTVHDSITKKGADADLALYLWDVPTKEWVEVDNLWMSDSDPSYSLTTLGPGAYKVMFSSGTRTYPASYWSSKSDLSGATTITVGSADITGINATLTPYPGSIAGRVTDSDSGQGLADADITVYKNVSGSWSEFSWGSTNGDGDYSVQLPDGTYRVKLDDYHYIDQYWNGKADIASGNDVSVAGTVTAGINAALKADTPSITGHVLEASSTLPIGDAWVSIYSYDAGSAKWVFSTGDYTRTDGSYSIYGLGSGLYKVGVEPPWGSIKYDGGFYNDRTDLATADSVSTVGGTTKLGVDFKLGPDVAPPTITTNASGSFSGVAYVEFTATDWGSGVDTVSYQLDSGSVVTTSPGNAEIRVVAQGGHTVHYWAKDKAGNTSAHFNSSFTIDGGPGIPGSWSHVSGPSQWTWLADFVSPTTGFVADGETLRYTSNGGTSWTSKGPLPPILGDIYTMKFVDATHGWASGTHGQVYATADGGATWVDRSIGTVVDITSLSFVSSTEGWASGDMGYSLLWGIWHTTDGGANWTCQTHGRDGYLQGLSFSDANNGVAVGAYIPSVTGRVIYTHNGGATWTSLAMSGFMTKLWAADQIDATHAWVGGYEDSLIFNTTNGSAYSHFTIPGRQEGYGPSIAAIAFPTTQIGWISTDYDLYYTPNGGAGWSVASNVTGLTGLTFPDASHGWAVENYAWLGSSGGGLWAYTSSAPVVDTTAPTTTATSTPDGLSPKWANTDVTVTLSASDNVGGSGVVGSWYAIGSGSYGAYSAPIVVSQEGATTIHFYSKDNANNTETPKAVTVQVDKTKPVTGHSALQTPFYASAAITLSPTDPVPAPGTTTSGVDKTSYQLDSAGGPSVGTLASTSAVGHHTLKFWSTDRAGNVEDQQTIEFDVAAASKETSVTLNPTVATIVYGQTFTVTGTLNTGGEPIPTGATVRLMNGSTQLASALVGTNGAFTLSCMPAYPATLLVSFPGAGPLLASQSSAFGLNVKPIVGTPSFSGKPTSKKAATFTGKVSPVPTSSVKVTFYKVIKKKLKKFKSYSVKCNASGVWTLKLKLGKAEYRIRATYAGLNSADKKLKITK